MSRWAALALAGLLWACLPVRARASDAQVLHQASRQAATRGPANALGATVHSNAWFSLQAQYLRRIVLPWPTAGLLVGGGLDLPLYLWAATGRPDTLRGSARVAFPLWHWRWFVPVVDLQTRLSVQKSALDVSVAWDLQLTAASSFVFGRGSLSPFVAWRQGLATYLGHGRIVHDAFEDRYPENVQGVGGPKDGWVAGGNTRIPFGLAFGVDLPRRVALFGSFALVWTRSSLDVGMFDAMMLGLWPFAFEIGTSWRF